jgi:hypothetical protein
MRKVLVLPLLALAVVLPAALATAADDVNGPACANIVDTDWGYSGDGTTATVTFFLDTASCPSFSYALFVQDSPTTTTVVASNSERGDGIADETSGPGTDSVTVNAMVPPAGRDGNVCLYATTSVGRHVFDRAPDASCVELIPGGTAGASGFG